MRTFVFPLVAVFAGVLAQDINSLPACERSCVTNVVALGPSYDCPATNNGQSAPDCLCSKEAFAYAIRDCSQESCPEGTDIQLVQKYGLEYCQSAQASASGTSLAAIGVFSSGASGASTSSAGSSASASSSSATREPITTIPIISTITSGSSTEETTLGSTTIYSGETLSASAGTNSSTSSGNGTETGGSSSAVTTLPVVSTVTDPSTTRETTVGSSTEFSEATSSSSQGAGATMAPLRVVPAFAARQGRGFNTGAWIMQALGWTVVVVGLVQLMW